MGTEIAVNQQTFATAVLAASHETVVLVDFFATWCGPCQLLKPILQSLVKEYDFVLATVDIDQNPELANEYGVEGVPDVRIATRGKLIPGFVGVLEEEKIREILENLHLNSEIDGLVDQLRVYQSENNLPAAKSVLDQLFQQYPQHPKVAIAAAEFLIPLGKVKEATQMLNTIRPEQTEYWAIADSLRGKLLLQNIASLAVASELDEKYVGAAKHALVGQYETALESLLEIVGGDRAYQNDGARKAMVVIFNLLGKNHPLTHKFQQQLMLTLY
ncbi:tetratricopeptide repeat protein [[Limnothrix rosea] IAM M-220]|uniref:tetratricopeptide repeat protein n=1 Tax=[Limnothrix rosea] IAM M-220 TaxID=454133 RepID=UPI000968F765|nr:tetratricopeptide repeat protein [[Limnothrix rosea] IAM M-220]OKH12014.1 co-chaperone YbbN [[Limnothrix rosea] IAM M-220]